jgi:hypothetical protein
MRGKITHKQMTFFIKPLIEEKKIDKGKLILFNILSIKKKIRNEINEQQKIDKKILKNIILNILVSKICISDNI